MQQLASLEKSLAKTFEGLPRLPKGLVDWLVENAWWLVVIGVVLGAFGTLVLLGVVFGGSLLIGALGGVVLGGVVFIGGIISLATLIATVVIEAMAIQPLKSRQKRGWDLLFLASLVAFAGSVVGAVISLKIGDILGPLVGVIIGLYVLFELRGRYITKPADKKA